MLRLLPSRFQHQAKARGVVFRLKHQNHVAIVHVQRVNSFVVGAGIKQQNKHAHSKAGKSVHFSLSDVGLRVERTSDKMLFSLAGLLCCAFPLFFSL